MSAPLLLEIGCEEIPARMIAAAAEDLRARVIAICDAAGLAHGPSRAWGGTRRLAVRVESVAGALAAKDQLVIGPPAATAFDAAGRPTPAGAGFAKKQGIDPKALEKIETEKGLYAGFRRMSATRTLEEVLQAALPGSIAAMSFPKTMRWGDGTYRFVRPVHWVVALHGAAVLHVELMGVSAGRASDGHRFLAPGPIVLEHADGYLEALRAARVLVDPVARRAGLVEALEAAARGLGGIVVRDETLLDEVVDLVEWPGVVAGRFDPSFLELPKEILVTTLRHHQKSFSVRAEGGLLPAFLSVANTDRDPSGHVRRGNEWVVVGRLEDARFFWVEDRKRPLESRIDDLKRVTFHKKLGSYEDKARRLAVLARAIADALDTADLDVDVAVRAALAAKADLVTGLVGEFPELQGIVGGLMLRAEGGGDALADAVAEHYKPIGADDTIPSTAEGCVVAVADRLDTIAGLIRAGEAPTGSRDPFGLRRAASGVFRILAERSWSLTMSELGSLIGHDATCREFLNDRLTHWLADRGFTVHEIAAVRRRTVRPEDFDRLTLREMLARLEIVRTLRDRPDFAKLVELTKRVDNILVNAPGGPDPSGFAESHVSALALRRAHDAAHPKILAASRANDFPAVLEQLSGLVDPVAKFFDDVLVLDPADAVATRSRCGLLAAVRDLVTRDFDIRELAGQADSNR